MLLKELLKLVDTYEHAMFDPYRSNDTDAESWRTEKFHTDSLEKLQKFTGVRIKLNGENLIEIHYKYPGKNEHDIHDHVCYIGQVTITNDTQKKCCRIVEDAISKFWLKCIPEITLTKNESVMLDTLHFDNTGNKVKCFFGAKKNGDSNISSLAANWIVAGGTHSSFPQYANLQIASILAKCLNMWWNQNEDELTSWWNKRWRSDQITNKEQIKTQLQGFK